VALTQPRLASKGSDPIRHSPVTDWQYLRIAELPTPLDEAPPELSEGRPLFLKREDVHELGAFKWRGALPALEKYRGLGADAVGTASSGNHGAATAWAAERTGVRAVVFVPEDASAAKVALLEQLGAELHRVGDDLDESKELAREHAAANDLPFFEDGAEPAQFDGYAAIGEEIGQQLGRVPAEVIVPIGNGALIIGVHRGIGRVRGVVAKEAPVMALSVEAGRPVECDRCATFADGMAVRVALPLAVEEMQRGYPIMMVSEREIAHAVRDYASAGIRVEGAAASALAAFRQLEPESEPTVLIVTGRNIDDELHRRCMEEPDSFPD
jgi:threonine dehydratase